MEKETAKELIDSENEFEKEIEFWWDRKSRSQEIDLIQKYELYHLLTPGARILLADKTIMFVGEKK